MRPTFGGWVALGADHPSYDMPGTSNVLTRVALLLLLSTAGCSWQKPSLVAAPDEPAAPIRPFLTVDAYGVSWVVWQTAPGNGSEHDALSLYRNGDAIQEVAAEHVGGLSYAPLLVDCDDRATFAYRVAGMAAPQAVARPPCRSSARVTFSFITDTQGDLDPVTLIAEKLQHGAGDFVLHGGDVVQRGSDTDQWLAYHATTHRFAGHTPTVTTIGNHARYWDATSTAYHGYFSVTERPTWFLFTAGPVDVLVLDSEVIKDESFNRAQLAWLEQTTRALDRAPGADGRWRIVLTHQSPVSSSIANSSYVPFGNVEILERDYIPAFERLGIDLVLSGHTHIYERSMRGGVTYVVGGPAGGLMGILGSDNPYSLKLAQQRTVSFFSATNDSLLMVTVDLEGRVVDQVELFNDEEVTRLVQRDSPEAADERDSRARR